MIAKDTIEDIKRTTRFWMNDREAVLGIVLVLVIIGSINIFSSSFVVAEMNFGTPYFFLKRHGINLAIGIVALVFSVVVDYHKWRDWIPIITVAIIVGLVLVLIVGESVNGAQRWLSLGFMTIQPAEFAKIIAIFVEAAYIASRVGIGRPVQIVHNQLALYIIMFALIEKEPDGATASIVVGIPIIMMLFSNMRLKEKLWLCIGCVMLVVAIFIWQPYRLERLMTMLDPWSDPTDSGYQVVQSLQAIGSGGIFGMGIGVGISKYHYLPEAHTDFAFAIWCQEVGFLGAALVLILFAALAYYGVKISNSAKDPLGQMLGFGLTALIILQAVANLFMVSGWLPVIGVPLPFISYGGSSLLINLWAIGILLNIGRKSAPPKMLVTNAPVGAEHQRPRLRRIK
ncbi:MAG: cell division protein FtsW [Schwartzia sp.]|nr:cell division protein FtsW [Schwartzia sp. (in: firmicutes)]